MTPETITIELPRYPQRQRCMYPHSRSEICGSTIAAQRSYRIHNLKAIADDETDLDDLEEKLDRIIAKLETVNDRIRSDAEASRLKQAEDLLREAGYVQGVDGNWTLPT